MNDIVDVISSYGIQLKRAGSSYKGLSPFQNEKTPSFHVDPVKQLFYCFSSGVGGDVFSFVMQKEGVDFMTAARILANRAGIDFEINRDGGSKEPGVKKDVLYQLMNSVAEAYHRELLQGEDAGEARSYLEKREMDLDTIKLFQVGFAPEDQGFVRAWGRENKYSDEQLEAAGMLGRSDKGDQLYDRFRDRIMFPIRDELGRVVAFSGRILHPEKSPAKYINSPDTVLFKKSRILFGLDKARTAISKNREVLLCEGQIDVITCQTAGFDHAIAPQGTALTEQHARLIKNRADKVTIIYDSDSAGVKASLRSAALLLEAELSIRIASLPEGEDPDSVIKSKGPDAVADIINQSVDVIDFLVNTFAQEHDIHEEVHLMRVTRWVLEMIGHASGHVQREHLLQRAAARLNISEESLRADFKRHAVRTPLPEAEINKTHKPSCPPHELSTLELLIHHPEAGETIYTYVGVQDFTNEAARRLYDLLCQHIPPQDLKHDLTDDPEALRLLAQIEMTLKRIQTQDMSPVEAARQLVLTMKKKNLQQKRHELRQRMESASAAKLESMRKQHAHLTEDLARLRQGWESAELILQVHSDV